MLPGINESRVTRVVVTLTPVVLKPPLLLIITHCDALGITYNLDKHETTLRTSVVFLIRSKKTDESNELIDMRERAACVRAWSMDEYDLS